MPHRYLPFFLILWFGISSCAATQTIESTKITSTEIYQSYLIRANKFSTSVNATFRAGGPTGSTVDLDAPGKIEHNGKEMTESPPNFLKGTDYYSSAGEFVGRHKFIYTDGEGKVWENEISLEPLEITAPKLTISKTGGATIMLSRAAATDENVEFSIESEEETTGSAKNANSPEAISTLQYRFNKNRSAVTIEPFSLKDFVKGKAKLSLTVQKNKTAQQSAKGGVLDFSYESRKITVDVVN